MASLLCHPALVCPDLASSYLQIYQKSSVKGSFSFQWACRLRLLEHPDQWRWAGDWDRRGEAGRWRRRLLAVWVGRPRRRGRARSRWRRRCRGLRRGARIVAWERNHLRKLLRGWLGSWEWRVPGI